MQPVLTAELMRWYNTARIAQWRGSMANPEATGHHHRVSIHVIHVRSQGIFCPSPLPLWAPPLCPP